MPVFSHSPSLGNSCQCSVTLRVKKCFFMFSWNLLFESIASFLSLDSTGKYLAPSALQHLPFRYYSTLMRFLQAFSSAHQWVVLSFSSTNIPKSFSSPLLSVHFLPSHYLCLGLPQAMYRFLYLGLVELHNIQSPVLSVCLNSPTMINNIYKITELIPGAKGQVTFQVSESSSDFLLKTKKYSLP